jgi:hypothetical protein
MIVPTKAFSTRGAGFPKARIAAKSNSTSTVGNKPANPRLPIQMGSCYVPPEP